MPVLACSRHLSVPEDEEPLGLNGVLSLDEVLNGTRNHSVKFYLLLEKGMVLK